MGEDGPEASPAGAVDVIVVAAGESRRMDGIDKVTATVAGRPLLARTLAAIGAAPAVERIVVVVAERRVDEIAAAPWLPTVVARVVAGGIDRSSSVAAGLRALEALDDPAADGAFGPDWMGDGSTFGSAIPARPTAHAARPVLVHDGARPLVTPALVQTVAAATARHGAAIPVVPVAETLKRIVGDIVDGTVDRAGLAAAQTPQGVRRDLLRRAFAQFPPDGSGRFTDEAALLEACRIAVHAIPGDPANLKVTLPDDLRRVEAFLGAGAGRVGYGHDSHPFGPGEPLALGGVTIPGAPRLHGHSDGDVALHAVADALLGAAGLGDLGRLYPADARTPRGIASRELLLDVVARLHATGWRPASVDVQIVGARPRLGTWLEPMRSAIGTLLGVVPDAVNVKASTGNLAGMEGAGRGVSARVVATLAPA